MQAGATTLEALFADGQEYIIPAFQRPYVWSEDEQWDPLWTDIENLANRLLESQRARTRSAPVGTHYLGAIVSKSIGAVPGVGAQYSVIDGQQRTTTLQVLLHAAWQVVRDLGLSDDAARLASAIGRGGKADTVDRLKLRPGRIDRAAFEAAMTSTRPADVSGQLIEAHDFFSLRVREWIMGEGDTAGSPQESADERARALVDSLLTRLIVVAIALDHEDDDQLIFETLNDRGTPLLAADLIKNLVFQWGEEINADTERWAERVWLEFDEHWWRTEIKQGRLYRSRIDIFLQYWLTMRLRQEVLSDQVFRRFKEYAGESFTSPVVADAFLEQLRADARTFRGLSERDRDTLVGQFYFRVIETMELAATTPLLLWLLSDNHDVPEEQVQRGLAALESWVVRRTMLMMTMKNVNQVMVAMLSALDERAPAEAGDVVHEFLGRQEADSRVWPDDTMVLEQLPGLKLYGNVRQSRLRVVLEGIELALRSSLHDGVTLPKGLEIEHIMPREWRTWWDSTPPLDAEAGAARDRRVHFLGNLTLLNKRLNASASNHPWRDDELVQTERGRPRKGKRALLHEFGGLLLTRRVVEGHPHEWTDADIDARGRELAEIFCRVWPR
ncbi:DUF262 domain-containing HNH endonuclease family protein [Demequina sp. B12]|uniref:DUF262 domain-containing protein n=1 Tax=Demequina sp. B12 TaxID=2992757 RepID=UPI00237B99DA|nr:DUF262 domain-containing protein [Demequina sp. B12]MDE0573475.1 DUF262 domain-containing HNH endonuclease family protein [Demequina sp. B12]